MELRAAVWSGIGALLALTGLMHSYLLTGRDTAIDLPLLELFSGRPTPGLAFFPAWGTALGYGLAAVLFVGARWFTVPRLDGDGHRVMPFYLRNAHRAFLFLCSIISVILSGASRRAQSKDLRVGTTGPAGSALGTDPRSPSSGPGVKPWPRLYQRGGPSTALADTLRSG